MERVIFCQSQSFVGCCADRGQRRDRILWLEGGLAVTWWGFCSSNCTKSDRLPCAGTALISLIKSYACASPPTAESRAEYIFFQSVCFHCCPLKIMSSFYSLARKATLDRFEIVYLLLSAFLQWFHSFVCRGTQPAPLKAPNRAASDLVHIIVQPI